MHENIVKKNTISTCDINYKKVCMSYENKTFKKNENKTFLNKSINVVTLLLFIMYVCNFSLCNAGVRHNVSGHHSITSINFNSILCTSLSSTCDAATGSNS